MCWRITRIALKIILKFLQLFYSIILPNKPLNYQVSWLLPYLCLDQVNYPPAYLSVWPKLTGHWTYHTNTTVVVVLHFALSYPNKNVSRICVLLTCNPKWYTIRFTSHASKHCEFKIIFLRPLQSIFLLLTFFETDRRVIAKPKWCYRNIFVLLRKSQRF